jgi:oligoendopeptidase F
MTTDDLTWNTALLYPAPDSQQLEGDLSSFER